MLPRDILNQYLAIFPQEQERLRQFTDFLKNGEQDRLADKTNAVGHITASAIVLSPCRSKVLLLLHKALRKYLQPGGHVEAADSSFLSAALREVTEETTLAESTLEHVPYHFQQLMPIDIDTHQIPESKKDNVGPHYHHDFRYLFVLRSENEAIRIDDNESSDYQWVPINDLLRMRTWEQLVPKINYAVSRQFRPRSFYRSVCQTFPFGKQTTVIAVAHLIPDVIPYLESLQSIANSLIVIPKPNSIKRHVFDHISKMCRVEQLTRQQIATGQFFPLLEGITDDVLLMDIGGYFAPVADSIAELLGKRLVGIVEDTENGHQKYFRNGSNPKALVYSVARSPLKDNEDFLVGQSILFSADVLLRQENQLLQYLTCSVFGYGKIGRSIAFHLNGRGVKANVFDTNAIRRLFAHNQLHATPSKDWILKNSDVLFCATGAKVLDILDFRKLKHGAYVFSVTSSDDEFDFTFLESEYQREDIGNGFTRYSSFNNQFFLANAGNAVNFLHDAVVGTFIHCVRAEMIAAASLLSRGVQPGTGHTVGDDIREQLASIWLETFVDTIF